MLTAIKLIYYLLKRFCPTILNKVQNRGIYCVLSIFNVIKENPTTAAEVNKVLFEYCVRESELERENYFIPERDRFQKEYYEEIGSLTDLDLIEESKERADLVYRIRLYELNDDVKDHLIAKFETEGETLKKLLVERLSFEEQIKYYSGNTDVFGYCIKQYEEAIKGWQVSDLEMEESDLEMWYQNEPINVFKDVLYQWKKRMSASSEELSSAELSSEEVSSEEVSSEEVSSEELSSEEVSSEELSSEEVSSEEVSSDLLSSSGEIDQLASFFEIVLDWF